MDIIQQNTNLIRKALAGHPELVQADLLISSQKRVNYMDRHKTILFRDLDTVVIIVRSASAYIDRTSDYSIEPYIDVIGREIGKMRSKL
jgi:hypothetical protein